MARKRYQQGSLILRGTRVKKWYGRWLEDELQLDGSIIRIHRSEVLGDKSEFRPSVSHNANSIVAWRRSTAPSTKQSQVRASRALRRSGKAKS